MKVPTDLSVRRGVGELEVYQAWRESLARVLRRGRGEVRSGTLILGAPISDLTQDLSNDSNGKRNRKRF